MAIRQKIYETTKAAVGQVRPQEEVGLTGFGEEKLLQFQQVGENMELVGC